MDVGTLYEIEGMELFERVNAEVNIVQHPSFASNSQIAYFMQLIKAHRFNNGDYVRNVMEVGVCTGRTSLFMLRAGCERDDFTLYGIDKSGGKTIGFNAFDNITPEERARWKLYTDSTTYDIDRILNDGEKLDVVFIDAMHAHPGPLIDFLMLYPYMRDDAVVVFHDVENYMDWGEQGACYFYTGWSGKKRTNYFVTDGKTLHTENMGIIDIERTKEDIYADLIQIAGQPITGCKYLYSMDNDPLGIERSDLTEKLAGHLDRFYPKEFTAELMRVLLDRYDDYKSKWIYYKHQNKIINSIFEHNDLLRYANLSYVYGHHIAVWGAGYQGNRFMENVAKRSDNTEVAAWVDSCEGITGVKSPEYLREVEFDYLIIAVENKASYDEIKDRALELGVSEDKIKWLFAQG